MRIMAIDLGAARTGIAMSDLSELLASPFTVVAQSNMDIVMENVIRIMEEEKVSEAVVGNPKHINGDEGEGVQKATAFANLLSERTSKLVTLWDERYSTKIAHQYYNESGKKGAKTRRKTIDSAAAAVILQSYLDFKRNTQDRLNND